MPGLSQIFKASEPALQGMELILQAKGFALREEVLALEGMELTLQRMELILRETALILEGMLQSFQ